MQQPLINLSPDLKQLVDAGYDIEILEGRFLCCKVPYVTLNKVIKYGTLVCSLTLSGPNRTARPPDHTMFFIGETPCDVDGLALNAIINHSNKQHLCKDVWSNFYFSSKPLSGRYENYYEKVRTYAQILSSHVRAIDSSVTARPHIQTVTV